MTIRHETAPSPHATRAEHVQAIIRRLDTAIPEAKAAVKGQMRDGELGLRPYRDLILAAEMAVGELMLRYGRGE